MDPLLDLKGKGEGIMEAEEIQLKRNIQRDGQSAVTNNNKYVIQMMVAFAFMVYSFTLMCAVVGGVNGIRRVVRGDTIRFSIFSVADTLVFVASSAITMMLATGSHASAKMEYFIRITLLAAGVFFVFIFHAIAYAVMPPNQKWIALCFGGAGTIALAVLLFHQFSTTFPKGSGMAS